MLTPGDENWAYVGYIALALGLILYSIFGVLLAKFQVKPNPKTLDQILTRVNYSHLYFCCAQLFDLPVEQRLDRAGGLYRWASF
jgi:hypothetical protein